MLDRRHFLMGSAIAAATLALPVARGRAQNYPSVEEVLFDPDIPVLGNREGDVTVVEYFDYQCPYCKKGHPDVMNAVNKDGKVRLVMKDWPIFGAPSVHAASLVLAQPRGGYEKAMEALMATKGRLSKKQVDDVLKKAGFDPAAMDAAFTKDRKRIDGILARNMDQANAFGFAGTPSFIVGTQIFNGVMDEKALTQAIRQARAK